jgi:hypothetical protein
VQLARQQDIPVKVPRITIDLIKYLRTPLAVTRAQARIDAWQDQTSILHKIRDTMTQYTDVIQRCGKIHLHLKNDEDRGAILQRVNALHLWAQVKADVQENETIAAAQVYPARLY